MDSRAHTLQGLVDSGRFPTFTKVVGSFHDGYDLRLDALFERGLEALLDGLAPVIESGGRPADSAHHPSYPGTTAAPASSPRSDDRAPSAP